MKRTDRAKKFDCVEMKRRGAALIYEAIKDMTAEQEMDYGRQVNKQFERKQEERHRSPKRAITVPRV